MKWVRKYISLFGGDPNQVTITGESAGGSNVIYHSVAYGGSNSDENSLFIRGIAQSPSINPVDPSHASYGANLFFQLAGVSSADGARNLSSETLMEANRKAHVDMPFLTLYFFPNVDGDLIPDIPLRLYSQGKFNKDLAMIAANNNNEASLLTNNSVTTDAQYDDYIQVNFPSAPQHVRDYITNTLYPPTYDGSLPYTNPQGRLQLTNKEFRFSCTTYSLARAYSWQTHNYIFSIDPAYHAQDLAYTYYPTGATPGFYPAVAEKLQGYLTNFVLYGDPNDEILPIWPVYTEQARVLNITAGGPTQSIADSANPRCEWFDKALYRQDPSVKIVP